MQIPRIFHTIWVQGPLPESYQKWHKSWLEHHPGWEHRVWSEPDYLPLVAGSPVEEIYPTAVNHAQRTEIAARLIVYEHGGVWVDADFQCLRNIEELIDDCDIFCGEETPGGLSAGIWGATPKHPMIGGLVEVFDRTIREQRARGQTQQYGTFWPQRWLWTGKVKTFPPWVFYPYRWDQPDPGSYGNAYAVHHWAATWKRGDDEQTH